MFPTCSSSISFIRRTAQRTVEWGLVVADQYQGSGLGKQICDCLLLVSRQAGAQRIQCLSLFENIAVMRLPGIWGSLCSIQGAGSCKVTSCCEQETLPVVVAAH